MIALLSIIYLIPFFILSLIYSGQFLIIFFGYFLNLIVLVSNNSNSTDQAFNYFIIDHFIRAFSAISIIVFTKSLNTFHGKTLNLNKKILSSLQNYAYNKKLIFNLIFIQSIFICYVLIISPDLSILSFNRYTTISLAIPSIRYIYPFFIALSPSLMASSLLSIFTFKKLKFRFLHYLLSFLCLINVFLIGQRGFLLLTLIVAFLTSFIFSLYQLSKGKLYISEFKKWFFIFLSFPLIYNLRNYKKIFILKEKISYKGDFEQLRAWDGAIEVVKNQNFNIPPIFNNIYNFLNHQSRIEMGLQNSSDIINQFLNLYDYFDSGFGLNITIPIDLYVSFNGKWLWIPAVMIYYTFILYRYIKSTEYFLFTENNLVSYFLITCSYYLIFSSLIAWPLAILIYLEAHFIVFLANNKKTSS